MPLQATSGAASYDGFGGGVAAVPNYIEDVFSTYLYTGTGAAQTITNNIDLSGKGGLVWCKSRSGSISHGLSDTVTGRTKALRTNNFANQVTTNDSITSFNSNGFSLGTDLDTGWFNTNLANYVSWTFREQPKFFDIVTWTGNASNRTIAHSLGSVPGCIIVKRRDDDADWQVYHRSLANTEYLVPNTTAAKATGATRWNSTTATDTVFSIGTDATVNASGGTYIAYLFAHDAGGFGLTGTDNVISCGSASWSGGSDNVVNLGYEAQWVMYKRTDDVGNWMMWDTMRGMSFASSEYLRANLSDAAATFTSPYAIYPNATGFTVPAGMVSTGTYIYIAIRRGPMKVPTSGTTVFQPLTRSGTGSATTVTSTVRPDTLLQNWRSGGLGSSNHFMYDRLRGVAKALFTDTTDAESTQTATGINAFNNLSYGIAGAGSMNNGSATYVDYVFTRAPGFFDEVCYTGTGTATTFTHNLGVVPELMIVKTRSLTGQDWAVYSATLGNTGLIYLNQSAAANTGYGHWNSTSPTSTVFSVGGGGYNSVNGSGATYVAYLFATCAGVSKCFNYTGNGSSQTINCGFTGGARWILIKRTDSTGDWYCWDSARGIVSGNDPHLSLNTTAAEVTSDDTIDTDSTGFVVNQVSATNVNVSSATYIGIAIA